MMVNHAHSNYGQDSSLSLHIKVVRNFLKVDNPVLYGKGSNILRNK